MTRLILRKFCYACMALFLVATLTFALMKAIPGDPFQQEQALPKGIYKSLREHYGLNDPWPVQYVRYLKQMALFNLGPSLVYNGRTVSDIIWQGMPISAILGAEALLIALPFGILLGTLAAVKHNQWQDRAGALLSVMALSLPSFILATFLQYLLAIKLDLLPIARWGTFPQTILPALSLAALPMAFISRLTRAKMISELGQDYVKAARAKGLSQITVIFRHALRNAFIPLLGYFGPLAANILTGSFIIEKIYGIPGLGYWFVMSVLNRDYTLIMGITMFYCAILLFLVFIFDLASILLDPRISTNMDI